MALTLTTMAHCDAVGRGIHAINKAVFMGIHCDTFLVDQVTSVGDAAFKVKSSNVFLHRIEGYRGVAFHS